MVCDRTYVTLRIIQDNLDPSLVSERLGLESTRAFRCGDPHTQGSEHIHRFGCWSLSTEDMETVDVNHHIDELLKLIEPRARELAQLRSDGADLDIFGFWSTSDGQGALEIGPVQMERLSKLGLKLTFDIYGTDEDARD